VLDFQAFYQSSSIFVDNFVDKYRLDLAKPSKSRLFTACLEIRQLCKSIKNQALTFAIALLAKFENGVV
jgi:hypothetical protein